MVKSKNNRKSNNKKKPNTNTMHPHIELIQTEISALQEEIKRLDGIQEERELETAEQHEKDIVTACLEKYQATLAKLNDASMSSKLRSYQDAYNSKKNEAQILFLLQFFYIVRLGQLGLFDVIEMEACPKAILRAVTDLCDQLIGASVYHATELSPITKTQKRKQVADILKKLETNSEDVILENISFKDIKDLIQHIWDNTVNEAQVLENTLADESAAKEWAVIQFENMVQNGESTSEHNDEVVEQRTVSEEKEQEVVVEDLKKEAPQQELEQQQPNESVDQEPLVENQPSPPAVDKSNNEASTANEWDQKDNVQAPVVSEWDKKEASEGPVVDEWNKKDTHVEARANAWDKKEKSNTRATKEWTDRKSTRSSTKANWKSRSSRFSSEPKEPENWDANENRGWNVIDNTVKETTNDGTDKNWTSSPSPPPATEEEQQQPTDNLTFTPDEQQQPAETNTLPSPQANTPPASPKSSDIKEQQESFNSETNDNWRRRGIEEINNSRGRGSSYRGGYRSSSRGGKFRGGGSSGGGRGRGVGGGYRGRGRGRGRGTDLDNDEQHHSSPSQ
ncbi:hypothetical protein PS6_008964 [Mucor atramentarius]